MRGRFSTAVSTGAYGGFPHPYSPVGARVIHIGGSGVTAAQAAVFTGFPPCGRAFPPISTAYPQIIHGHACECADRLSTTFPPAFHRLSTDYPQVIHTLDGSESLKMYAHKIKSCDEIWWFHEKIVILCPGKSYTTSSPQTPSGLDRSSGRGL